MNHFEQEPITARRTRSTILAGLITVGIAFFGYQLLATSSSTAVYPINVVRDSPRPELGESGKVAGNVTVFDRTPAVANLDPGLLHALRSAADDAAGDGVHFVVNSGWRSKEYQEQLLREAISKYGSKAEAERWVATPNTSAHVSGDAVDLGPTDATSWLSQHGASYGLCQIYSNEPWHYELRPNAASSGCPRMYADPTHDPRMNR